MSRSSKAIPGLAVGDTVWVALYGDGSVPLPGTVFHVLRTASEADVVVPTPGARRSKVYVRIYTKAEGQTWWRTGADVRSRRRASLCKAVADAEAALAAFDAEAQP